MFDIGLQEMVVIGVLALLVFGPSKLPELGRMVGRALREFRRASDEFRSTVETNLHINDPDPIMPSPPPVDATANVLPTDVDATIGDATVAADPKTVAAAEPGEPFCAQRGSRLLHKSDCSWVARIPEAERSYFKHIADARDQGLLTCPVCEPWEPA
jgi:TatA/E family protein of Tat protein translocase